MINTGLNKIEFIFKNSIWIEDYYDPFLHVYLQTEEGIVLEN
ncbi:hypothetical protein HNQ03_002125 [Chryseobacterium sp. 16F]|uniref:Uncharacterized protein n=1 Tax=Frigoriflavimonas asaccharolytica TaxID=2735899 RepID=A0A8J8GBQ9_9FLAO|nr:hypothetical protein [Frigoriflavimonas asaccharolytica]